MHPVIGSLVVGLTDPQLLLGVGLLVLTLALIRARALLRQPQQPRQPRQPRQAERSRRRPVSDHSRGRGDRAPN